MLVAALMLGVSLYAQDEVTLVLQQGLGGYEGTRDNTMYDDQVNNANGGGDFIFAGATARDAERRALIAFDLDQIPAGATITSVTLTLTVTRTLMGNAVISAHRLLADWGEGDENAGGQEGLGANAQQGSATWRENFKGESAWETPGGDFVSPISASDGAGVAGSEVTLTDERMVADVQAWVNGEAENFGWILLGSGTAKRFDSADNEASQNKPTLTITYTQ